MNNPFLVCSDRELRALPAQWLRAEQWDKVGSLLYDLMFLEAAVRRLGIDDLLQGFSTALRLLPKEDFRYDQLLATNKLLARQAHYLHNWDAETLPALFLQCLRNEAFQLGLNDLKELAEVKLAQLGLPYVCQRFRVSANSGELTFTLIGHNDWVRSVTLSADGKLAISVSSDNIIKVWDITIGRELYTLKGNSLDDRDMGRFVAVSADGRLAVSSTETYQQSPFSTGVRYRIKVWDVTTRQELRTFSISGNDLKLSGDGKVVLSLWKDAPDWKDTLELWDVVKVEERETGYMHPGALSFDGSLFLSKWLEVWDMTTSKKLRKFNKGHEKDATDVALSADGRLAVSAHDKILKVWDVATGNELQVLKGHRSTVTSIALSADGRLAVSASDDHTLKVWDVAAGQELRTLTGHSGRVTSVAMSIDGRLVISASVDKTLKVWDISEILSNHLETKERDGLTASNMEMRSKLRTFQHLDNVNKVMLSADGRLAISQPVFEAPILWDVEMGCELRRFEDHKKVALSANGKIIISISNMTLQICDVAMKRKPKKIKKYEKAWYVPDFVLLNCDGSLAITELEIWDLVKGKKLRNFQGHHSEHLITMTLSIDESLVISASQDKTIKVWDVATGHELRTLEGHNDWVTGVALSADNCLLISTSKDHTVKLWDATIGRELCTLVGNSGPVEFALVSPSVALSADGQLAISTSRNILKVWKISYSLGEGIATGQVISIFQTTGVLGPCAMTPDGKNIIVGDDGGVVHFLELVDRGESPKTESPLIQEIVKNHKEVKARSGWLPTWLNRIVRRRDS